LEDFSKCFYAVTITILYIKDCLHEKEKEKEK